MTQQENHVPKKGGKTGCEIKSVDGSIDQEHKIVKQQSIARHSANQNLKIVGGRERNENEVELNSSIIMVLRKSSTITNPLGR